MKIKTKIKKSLKWCFENKKRKLFFSLFLILLIILPLYFIFFSKKSAEASWWDEKWFYRKSIPVTNSSGGTLTDFQVKILDNYDLSADIATGKIQADLDDLRFTTINGEVLDYWIEDFTSNSVDIWLKIPSLATSGATIYFYYGNPQATPYADGNKVFEFFDDFNDNAIDSNKWAMQNFGEGGSYAEAEGQLQLTASNNLTGSATAKTLKNFTNNVVIEWKRYDTEEHYNDFSFGYGSVVGESEVNYWHTYSEFGYINSIQTNANYLYIRNNGVGGWLTSQSNIDGPDAGQWIKYKNIYSGSGLWNWYYDVGSGYTQLGTGQTNTAYLNNEKYILLSRGGYDSINWGGTSRIDYIFVRKYASTQPTAGTFGAEEKSPAPAGYWSFDEGYGTVAHDESSNKNNGTITGATWKNENECLAGKCLYFDGTDDYVDLGNSSVTQFDGGTYDFSVSAWIKPNSATVKDRTIIGRWGNEDNNASWVLKIESDDASGKWAYHKFGSTYSKAQSSAQSIQINKWHHLMGVKSGGEIKLYIDGVLANTNSDTGSIFDSASNLLIGYGNQTDHFQGLIDEVKIYNYARTTDQVKQDYNAGLAGQSTTKGASAAFGSKSNSWLTDGLVGHWKMDETSGTTMVVDASGNGNNGTLTSAQETGTSDASGNTTTTIIDTDGTLSTVDDVYNGMIFRNTSACGSIASGTERLITDYIGATKTFAVAPALTNAPDSCSYEIRHQVEGKYGNGISFDGVNDYAVISDDLLDSSKKYDLAKTYFTASAWVKLPTLGSNKYIFSKKGSSNRGWYLIITPTGEILFASNGIANSTGKTAQNTIADTNWHHIVLVRNDSTFHVYLDGIEKTLVQQMVNMPDYGSGNLHIGAAAPTFSPPTSFTSQYIDEARIYNRALSSDEVKKLYDYAPGPVMHLKMDEKEGTTAFDSSGNGNNGTLLRDTKWFNGKINGAADFDGVGDVITFADGPQWNSAVFTASAWVNFRSETGSYNMPISSSGNTDNKYYFDFNNNKIEFKVYGNPGWVVATYLIDPRNEWHFISGVFDGFFVYLYVDGMLRQKTAFTGNYLTSNGAPDIGNFGDLGGDAYAFNGLIDDIKIYNYARTQEQILQDMGGSAGALASRGAALKSPVLDLGFDEGMGDTAHNDACTGASQCVSTNGTLSSGTTGANTTTSAMWDKNGKFGGAMEFDGVDDYINLGHPQSLELYSDLSVSFCFEADGWGSGGLGRILNKRDGAYAPIDISVDNDGIIDASGWDNLNQSYKITSNIVLGRWYCGVFTYSDNMAKLYLDGKLVGSDNTTADLKSQPTYNWYVGMDIYNRCFDGLIDEFKVYNYALSEDEIKTLYNGGNAMSFGGEIKTANNNGVTVTGDAAEYCIPGDTAKCDKPVLELKMDEKSGTTTFDTSGNGNNGTLISGPIWDRGKVGGALIFDGVDDVITVGDSASWDIGTGDFTINTQVMFADNSEGVVFGLDDYTNGVMFYVYQGITYLWVANDWTSYTWVPDKNKWYNVIISRSSGVVKTYINGLQIGVNATLSGNVNTSLGFRLGYGFAGSANRYLEGKIDNFQFFNYARNYSQLAWDYNRGKPIAHWKMDEGEGLIAHDENINQNSSTVTGATWENESNCKTGKCLSFDGDNDAVTTNANVDLSKTDKASVSLWFKYASAADTKVIFELSSDFNTNNAFFIDHSESSSGALGLGDHCGSNFNSIFTSNSYGDNQWHHLVGTIDRSLGINQSKIYVDGQLAETTQGQTYDCSGNFGSYPFYVGARGGTTLDYMGLIDDVKIYNYVLTLEQIKQDYAGGAVNFK